MNEEERQEELALAEEQNKKKNRWNLSSREILKLKADRDFIGMVSLFKRLTPEEIVSFKNKGCSLCKNKGATLFESERPLTLKVKFFLKRPKNKMRKKDSVDAIACCKRPDLDNLIKAIQDGMNGIVYNDDSQIHKYEAEKFITK